MVAYDFYCDACCCAHEVQCRMEDRDTVRECPMCGRKTARVYGTPPHYWKDCEWPGGYRPKGTPSE